MSTAGAYGGAGDRPRRGRSVLIPAQDLLDRLGGDATPRTRWLPPTVNRLLHAQSGDSTLLRSEPRRCSVGMVVEFALLEGAQPGRRCSSSCSSVGGSLLLQPRCRDARPAGRRVDDRGAVAFDPTATTGRRDDFFVAPPRRLELRAYNATGRALRLAGAGYAALALV